MNYKYSVTFEHDLNPCRTSRGMLIASGPATAANRAIKIAKKEFKGVRWSSLVVVLEKQSGTDNV